MNPRCHNRWAYLSIKLRLCLWCEERDYFEAPAAEELIRPVRVILYAAVRRTWSQMLSDPVCGSNKVGIRCTFKLPGRMPSRDDFIWCCLGTRKCRDWLLTKASTIKNITYSHTHSSDLYNEWLINPFRLSHILFWPHWAALWSVEYQPSMSTGSTLMRTESQTQWRHYYNSWGLLFLILLVFCLPFRIWHCWVEMWFETRDLNLLITLSRHWYFSYGKKAGNETILFTALNILFNLGMTQMLQSF